MILPNTRGYSLTEQNKALGIARVCCGQVTKWTAEDGQPRFSFGGIHKNGWASEYNAAIAYCKHNELPFTGQDHD